MASRDENNPGGAVEWKSVEELFQRTAGVITLTVNGREIRTTSEHPFYHEEKGWLPAGDLTAGDRLVGQYGEVVIVNKVEAGGEHEAVYNLRVADWHTYFVGDEGWGFGVWAHNAEYAKRMGDKIEIFAKRYARNLKNGKDTNWGNLSPKQQRSVKEFAVAKGFVDSEMLHNNSLNTTAKPRGYILKDRDTGEILKYGETTKLGSSRYSQKFLDKHNAEMVFEKSGTKRAMHRWQNEMILKYIELFGFRPRLNKSNY